MGFRNEKHITYHRIEIFFLFLAIKIIKVLTKKRNF